MKDGLFFADPQKEEKEERMEEASLCIEDLMELKCSTIIEDSIQLIPFENTFAEEAEEEEILDPEGAFAKMRRSLVGSPLVTKDNRYACPHCNKTFSQKYIVPRHIRWEDECDQRLDPLFRTVHMDHYSKCNLCGEMVKNMRQHNKHKHRGNPKASVATVAGNS